MWRAFSIGLAGGFVFLGGWQSHQYLFGEVRVLHNIYIAGDPLNRGQFSLDVSLPWRNRVDAIKLPDGTVYPKPGAPRWEKVFDDGSHETWINNLSFEAVPTRVGAWEQH